MSTQFRPLEIPPGVVAKPTKQQRSSNWAEVNLMRWVEGQMAPVGGQSQYNFTFASRCKKIHGWFDLNQVYHIAFLCEQHLYVLTGGVLVDISPTTPIISPTLAGQGGYGDGRYNVGEQQPTTAFAVGATAITLQSAASVWVQPTMDVYNVTRALTDPTTAHIGKVKTIAGTALVLVAGAEHNAATGDQLMFDWYGGPRPIDPVAALDKAPSAYSLDNFGSFLYAMTSADGRLLKWDPAAGTIGNIAKMAAGAAFTTTSPNITMSGLNPSTSIVPGTKVFDTTNNQFLGLAASWVGNTLTLQANAAHASQGAADVLQFYSNVAAVQVADSGRGPVPLGRCFVITNERYVMMFGTESDGTVDGGKMNRFAWCDQENPGAWDYTSVTSQAGFLDIEPASPIIAASATRNGIIFFTAKKAYNSVYLGMPYIYNFTELGNNCTPWSPQSISNTSSMIIWMSKQGMFSFDGTSIIPMNCLVRPWVDDDIDILQVREQACMVHVGDFNEVWWFFPQDGKTKNTRCIYYSYKEGWWGMGQMARTAGITSSYTAHTIMADDLIAFQHEVPYAYPANVPLPWAETYDLNLNSGARLTTVKQLIPDISGAIQSVLYSLFYRMSRTVMVDHTGAVVPVAEQQTSPQPVRSNGYVDFRTTGRDIRLKIEIGALPGQPRPPVMPVTMGQCLIDSVQRGDR